MFVLGSQKSPSHRRDSWAHVNKNGPALACVHSFAHWFAHHSFTYRLIDSWVPLYCLSSVRPSLHAWVRAFMHEIMHSFQLLQSIRSVSFTWVHAIRLLWCIRASLILFHSNVSLQRPQSMPLWMQVVLFGPCSSCHCICFILLLSCHSCLFIKCIQCSKHSSNPSNQLFISRCTKNPCKQNSQNH